MHYGTLLGSIRGLGGSCLGDRTHEFVAQFEDSTHHEDGTRIVEDGTHHEDGTRIPEDGTRVEDGTHLEDGTLVGDGTHHRDGTLFVYPLCGT